FHHRLAPALMRSAERAEDEANRQVAAIAGASSNPSTSGPPPTASRKVSEGAISSQESIGAHHLELLAKTLPDAREGVDPEAHTGAQVNPPSWVCHSSPGPPRQQNAHGPCITYPTLFVVNAMSFQPMPPSPSATGVVQVWPPLFR